MLVLPLPITKKGEEHGQSLCVVKKAREMLQIYWLNYSSTDQPLAFMEQSSTAGLYKTCLSVRLLVFIASLKWKVENLNK